MTNQEQLEAMLAGIDQDTTKQKRNYFKLDSKFEGEEQVRLLLPIFKKEEKLPYFRLAVHYVNNRTYVCLNQTLLDKDGNVHSAESCPFCNEKERLYKLGEKDSEEWKIAGQLKAKDQFFYRGIVRSAEDVTNVEFVNLPKTIHEELIEKLKSKRYGLIFDFLTGRDIIINKKGTGILSKYTWDLLDASKIFDDESQTKKVVENMMKKNYNELVSFPTKDMCLSALSDFLGSPITGNPTAKNVDDVFQKTERQEISKPKEQKQEENLDDILNEMGLN
jgi:hypothetical protein